MELARLFADVLVAYGRTGMQKTGGEKGWKTPFEVEAAKEGLRFEGGKIDE
jgi:protein phosphatase PTC7